MHNPARDGPYNWGNDRQLPVVVDEGDASIDRVPFARQVIRHAVGSMELEQAGLQPFSNLPPKALREFIES
ncbi:MAG TPA: hypothetical protein VFT92_06020 [Nitrospira sp.]|nr:hypothetical protein [Nitrospira sp.]